MMIGQRDWGAVAVLACLGVAGFWMWSGTKPLELHTNTPAIQPLAAPRFSGAVTASATPETVTMTSSAASFVDGELYACTDFSMSAPADAMAKAAARTDASVQASLIDLELKELRGGANGLTPRVPPQLLAKSCGQQFGRPIVATCLLNEEETTDAGTKIELSMRVGYVQIPPDTTAAACIAQKGDWTEVARDSLEYIQAHSRETLRVLHKQLGQ